MFHNAARNGRLWTLAFLLRVEASQYPLLQGNAVEGEGGNAATAPATPATAGGVTTNSYVGGRVRGGVAIGQNGGDNRAMMMMMMTMVRDPAVASLLRCTDCDGHTALDWACYSGHTGVARLLVEHGLSPFSTDSGGKNCLHWAANQVLFFSCFFFFRMLLSNTAA